MNKVIYNLPHTNFVDNQQMRFDLFERDTENFYYQMMDMLKPKLITFKIY